MKTPAPGAPDLHWGQGGQYVIDLATGLRVRLGTPAAAPGTYASSLAMPETTSSAPQAETTPPAATADALVVQTDLVIDAATQRADTNQPKKGTK